MWSDLFQRCDKFRVFFYEIFHAAHIDPFSLHGEEEGILISWNGIDHFPLIKVVFQHITDFIAEVDHGFLSAFPVNSGTAGIKVDIIDI